jgi:tetratricopeptide (TPR) repeat protein
LACAVGLAYLPALSSPFVWDDVPHITRNPSLANWSGALAHFGRPEGRYHRPIVFLSYFLDRALWGTAPVGFHLTNLLLHVLNVLLLVAVARRSGVSVAAALAAGTLFGLHPIQTEAVVYVSGRTDLLVAAAGLLAWRVMLAGVRPALRAFALSAAIAVAALAKESGFALIPFMTWLALNCPVTRRERLAVLAPVVATGLVLLALRGGMPAADLPADLLRHLGGAGVALAVYARLLLWPSDLQVDRLTVLPATPVEEAFGLAVLALAAGLVLWGLCRGTRPVAGWTLWAAVFYLPVANLLPLYPAIAAYALFTPEHNLYVPLAGIAVLIGLGLERLIGAASARRRWAALATALLVTGALGARTYARGADWQSEERLYAAAVRSGSRSPRVYYNLANIRLERGDAAEAAALYEAALRLAPGDGQSWTNLGVARERLGDLDGARDAYENAARLLPANAMVWENLGALHIARGDLDAARRALGRALAIDPTRPNARAALDTLERLPPRP